MADFIDMIQSMGNGPDSQVAHVTPGEIVIPKEVQDEEPQVVQAFIKAMTKAGLPWRQFVVGAKEGSVNERTGLQEFQFELDGGGLERDVGARRAANIRARIGGGARAAGPSGTRVAGTISGLTPRQERARIATFSLFGGEEADVGRFASLLRTSPSNQLLPIERAFLEREAIASPTAKSLLDTIGARQNVPVPGNLLDGRTNFFGGGFGGNLFQTL